MSIGSATQRTNDVKNVAVVWLRTDTTYAEAVFKPFASFRKFLSAVSLGSPQTAPAWRAIGCTANLFARRSAGQRTKVRSVSAISPTARFVWRMGGCAGW